MDKPKTKEEKAKVIAEYFRRKKPKEDKKSSGFMGILKQIFDTDREKKLKGGK